MGFSWRSADAYLFDIDGTLLRDPGRIHSQAFVRAVREAYGVEINLDGLTWLGMTDLGILRESLARAGVPAAKVEPRLAETMERAGAEVARRAGELRPQLFPAVEEVVAELQRAGRLLGIASGNLARIGWLKLEACGLRSCFAFGAFGDYNETREDVFRQGLEEVRRRLGAKASACFIGDTPADIQAAQRVGAPVIAVATGLFPIEQLRAHAPKLCVASCRELLTLP